MLKISILNIKNSIEIFFNIIMKFLLIRGHVMQIKVNGVTISVENSPVTSGNLALDNLEKQSMMLSKESEDITKMIRLYDIMSDVKAVESFGYRSTEGVGEKIANAAKEVWKRIKEFFIKIGKFIADLFANGAMVTRANMLLNKVSKMDEKDIDFDISISVTKLGWINSLRPTAYRDLGRLYSSSFDMLRGMKAGLKVEKGASSNAADIAANIEKISAANPFTRMFTENLSINDNGSPQIQILKFLKFNSKQSIIDFLNGVKTKSDPVTVSLNKAKADIDECIRELDKLLMTDSDITDADATNLKKGYTFIGKASSKLCSCGATIINTLLTGIGMSLKASAKNAASTNNQ